MEALARVDLELAELVGLEPVKEYCAALRGDLVARAALGDEPLLRNVLISGSLGTGKKLAARMLCDMARALGAAKGMTTTETTLDQLVLDVRRDVSCVVVEGLSGVESVKAKVNQVLHNFPRHLFVFLGPTKDVEALHGGLAYFRKAEPAWLQLANYPAAQLAAITEQQLRASGYALEAGVGVRELQQALCSTWSRDVLSMRNAHLPTELVQRAISTRNRRLPLSTLLRAPLILSEPDFGLETQGLQSLLAERQATEAEVAELIGMAPLKAFLRELKAKVDFVQGGGDPRLLEGCLNVVLTGNPGAGKTTAARLLFRSLRAYGLLKKNVFVERNALELKGTHIGWTCPQVKEMVQAALGGCLFLDEAYALSGGGRDGDRGDSFSDEALRTLLTETENNRSSLCVVLAGYRDGMAHLMRADPGLVRRFPTALHLDDYTPSELAAIAKQTAATRYGLQFSEGLEPALAEHIAQVHTAEISKHNASLAVQLVEAAMNRLAARLVSSRDPTEPPESQRTLVASDFAILPQGSSAAGRRTVDMRIDSLPTELFVARHHLEALRDRLAFVSAGGSAAALRGATRLVLCGSPGTDASTVVSALFELLQAHNVLTGAVVSRSALALAGESSASVTAKLEDILDTASGGMLVLHDVGALATAPGVSRALAAALADVPHTTAVVLVGLPEEAAALLQQQPTLAALFPAPLTLPDLSPTEVANLVRERAANDYELSLGAGVHAQLQQHLQHHASHSLLQNGALADSLLQAAVGRLATRAASSRSGPLCRELCIDDFAVVAARSPLSEHSAEC